MVRSCVIAHREQRRFRDILTAAGLGNEFYVPEVYALYLFELLRHVFRPHIRQVISELSTPRVLTTEMVYGLTIDQAVDTDQQSRNVLAEKVGSRVCA